MSDELKDELQEIEDQSEALRRAKAPEARKGIRYALDMAIEGARLHGATEGQILRAQATPELRRRFTYHRPGPEMAPAFEAIRDKALEFAMLLEASCPPGRETANAVTHIEDAVMWANAGIARPPSAAPRALTMERPPQLSRPVGPNGE